ncbi:M23 family metallopeptidase [Frondihabitans sp. PAMC 28766]|uniref:M23 family metallopeptidase n=1 Tax=Frondihabitans sp. PAMC 28766 TaxID=1795630 RepID=UPI0012FFD289|nr:M23 family metallopeptidase [Frondihabitans sp. PAMC 28766]
MPAFLVLAACGALVSALAVASPAASLGSVVSVGSGAAAGPAARKAPGDHALPRWSWPVPSPHDVIRGYDAPEMVWSPGHRGIDIAAAPGAIVHAPDSGRVHFTGTVVDRPVLSLEHAGGVLSSFEPVDATVAAGEAVSRGQAIGILRPGHCPESACLHLGARVDGDYVSPLLLLGELPPSVLLPTESLP